MSVIGSGKYGPDVGDQGSQIDGSDFTKCVEHNVGLTACALQYFVFGSSIGQLIFILNHDNWLVNLTYLINSVARSRVSFHLPVRFNSSYSMSASATLIYISLEQQAEQPGLHGHESVSIISRLRLDADAASIIASRTVPSVLDSSRSTWFRFWISWYYGVGVHC
jgi:hypothetical protein